MDIFPEELSILKSFWLDPRHASAMKKLIFNAVVSASADIDIATIAKTLAMLDELLAQEEKEPNSHDPR